MIKMRINSLPKSEYIRSILHYDSDTGIFKWQHRNDVPQRWNKRWAGKRAGTINPRGYCVIAINGKAYRAHRLAYAYMNGRISEQLEIDHINGIRSDNRIVNLRLATKAENQRNSQGWRNRMLPKGVYKNRDKFVAQIMKDRKPIYLGIFDSPEGARRAHMKAARALHGDFARAQ